MSILFPPRSFSDAEQIAAIGDRVIDELEYRVGQSDKVNAYCIRALGMIGGKKAKRILLDYARRPGKLGLRELIQVSNRNPGDMAGLLGTVEEYEVTNLLAFAEAMEVVSIRRLIVQDASELELISEIRGYDSVG